MGGSRSVQLPLDPPGSSDAIERGCACDPIDNHHGAGIPDFAAGPQDVRFVIRKDCPLHGLTARPSDI